jgi:hypothetical protein
MRFVPLKVVVQASSSVPRIFLEKILLPSLLGWVPKGPCRRCDWSGWAKPCRPGMGGCNRSIGLYEAWGREASTLCVRDCSIPTARKKLTFVTKSNAQRNGMVLWDDVQKIVAKDYPDVETDKMLVDAMTCRMTLQAETIDTVVATNLHADILSDLAAALAGSIGIAPTSNLDPTRQNPSMFEPIHGFAWDIAGKREANPVGTFWTRAEMVKWLGQDEASEVLMEAVENVLAQGIKTRDLGGQSGTEEVTDRVCQEIEKIGKENALGAGTVK